MIISSNVTSLSCVSSNHIIKALEMDNKIALDKINFGVNNLQYIHLEFYFVTGIVYTIFCVKHSYHILLRPQANKPIQQSTCTIFTEQPNSFWFCTNITYFSVYTFSKLIQVIFERKMIHLYNFHRVTKLVLVLY